MKADVFELFIYYLVYQISEAGGKWSAHFPEAQGSSFNVLTPLMCLFCVTIRSIPRRLTLMNLVK